MDINLPGMNGVECVRQLKPLLPQTQVMMLTVYEDTENIFNALAAGASGYMLKRTSSQGIARSHPGSPARRLADDDAHRAQGRAIVSKTPRPAQSTENLSEREQQVLDLLSQGLMYKEISDKLRHQLRDRPHLHPPHLRKIAGADAHRGRGEIPPPLKLLIFGS